MINDFFYTKDYSCISGKKKYPFYLHFHIKSAQSAKSTRENLFRINAKKPFPNKNHSPKPPNIP